MPDETIASRDLLLREGARLIAERGFERVNTNLVAREAGVGIGTFYKHFGDKHELRAALVVRGAEALQRHVAERLAEAAPLDLAGEIRAHARAMVEFAAAEPTLFRVAFGLEAARSQSGKPGVGLSTRATERRLEALQRAGKLDPALDAGLAARAAGAMQIGLLCWWLDDPGRARADDLVDTLARLHPAAPAATPP